MVRSTAQIVEAQARGMGVPLFEVGVYQQHAPPGVPAMLPRTWDARTLLRSVGWLRLQNMNGANIFIRPKGFHSLTLLDDLPAKTLEHMKAVGFSPAVVVETSPGNFQAWLDHGTVLPKEMSTAAAKMLAQKFGADPSSADWRHFGRLGGFTNRKSKYQSSDGHFPFVKLIESAGGVYPHAPILLQELRDVLAQQKQQNEQARSLWRRQTTRAPMRDITSFRQKPAYKGDGNRIDLAYAIYALGHHLIESEVRAAIASRDLSHKGDAKRQSDYIDRTIKKAWDALRGPSR